MPMVMTLLLGLCLATPVQAADSGPVLLLPGLSAVEPQAGAEGRRCADFLEAAGLRPEGLEYLFCRPGTDARTGQVVLTARYRVSGARAAAVEAALRERTGMAALERQLGIWQLPEDGEGRFMHRNSGSIGPGALWPGTDFLEGGPPSVTVSGLDALTGGLAAAGTAKITPGGPDTDVPADGLPSVPLGGAGALSGGLLPPEVERPAAGGPDTAALRTVADHAGEAAGADGPDGLPSAAAGPLCTVSMGEVPQRGTFAATREDWAKIAWFAVTVRLPQGPAAQPAPATMP